MFIADGASRLTCVNVRWDDWLLIKFWFDSLESSLPDYIRRGCFGSYLLLDYWSKGILLSTRDWRIVRASVRRKLPEEIAAHPSY